MRSKWPLCFIALLYLLLAFAQSLWLPIFEGPDEQRHYAYARYLVNQKALPPLDKLPGDNSYNYRVGQMAGNPPLYYSLVTLVSGAVVGADAVEPFLQVNQFATAYDAIDIPYDNHTTYLHGHEGDFPWRGPALAVHLGRLISVAMGLGTVLAVAGIVAAVCPFCAGIDRIMNTFYF